MKKSALQVKVLVKIDLGMLCFALLAYFLH